MFSATRFTTMARVGLRRHSLRYERENPPWALELARRQHAADRQQTMAELKNAQSSVKTTERPRKEIKK